MSSTPLPKDLTRVSGEQKCGGGKRPFALECDITGWIDKLLVYSKMTDQDKAGNPSSTGASAVLMVEKTAASRHKAYRPTDLQDEAPVELHHKRSRAPAVPSVAEERKEPAENAAIKEPKEHKEHKEHKERKHVMSSEKPKRTVTKMPSKRVTSSEAIAMAPIEVDVKRVDMLLPSTQPIPAPVAPAASDIAGAKEVSENDDSITEEIAELRTADSSHKEWDTENCIQNYEPENPDNQDTVPLQRKIASEIINKIDNETDNKKDVPVVRETEVEIPLQRKLASGTVNENITSTKQLKKKEISWTHSTYLDKVELQNLDSRSIAWMLDRKDSLIRPCFRKTLPYGEPSGITICLPKKSTKGFDENIKPSKSGGISITMSKRCLDNNSKLSSDYEMGNRTDRIVFPRKENRIEIKIEEGNCVNFLENLKGKLDNWRGRIKHVLHM